MAKTLSVGFLKSTDKLFQTPLSLKPSSNKDSKGSEKENPPRSAGELPVKQTEVQTPDLDETEQSTKSALYSEPPSPAVQEWMDLGYSRKVAEKLADTH